MRGTGLVQAWAGRRSAQAAVVPIFRPGANPVTGRLVAFDAVSICRCEDRDEQGTLDPQAWPSALGRALAGWPATVSAGGSFDLGMGVAYTPMVQRDLGVDGCTTGAVSGLGHGA